MSLPRPRRGAARSARSLPGLLVAVAVALAACGHGRRGGEPAVADDRPPCVDPAVPDRPLPALHADLPFRVAGPWRLTDVALRDTYLGATRERFFGYRLLLGDDALFVPDLRYPVGDGALGYWPVPVNEEPGGTLTAPGGEKVGGYALLDARLREASGLGPDDPLFALLAYNHPERHDGSLARAADSDFRTEHGQTHLGAYLGGGRPLNAPEGYHDRRLGVAAYPATAYVVALDGVPQATLNASCAAWMRVLNDGVRFPQVRPYTEDHLETSHLAATLDLARRWVAGDPSVRAAGDPAERWATYCAEHVAVALDTCLNVPFSRAGFDAVWGVDGAALWEQARRAWRRASGGQPAPPVAWYEPLWRRSGAVLPLREDRPGVSQVWAPQATSDLLVAFVSAYTPFLRLGGLAPAAAVVGFRDLVRERLGMDQPAYPAADLQVPRTSGVVAGFDDDAFLALAVPVLGALQVADAFTVGFRDAAAVTGFARARRAALFAAFVRGDEGLAAALRPDGTLDDARVEAAVARLQPEPARRDALREAVRGAAALASAAVEPVRERAAALAACAPVSRERAWSWLRAEIAPVLAAARELPVLEGRVRWYQPPAQPQRIVLGLARAHPEVTVRAVATAFDHLELEPAP